MTERQPPEVATLPDDDGDPAATAPPRAFLLVLGGGQARTVPVPTDGLLVAGRDPSLRIPLDDEKASRRHAELRSAGGEVSVVDLGSTYGSFVYGVRLDRPRALAHGDEIRIGATRLTLLRPSRPVAGPRPPDVLRAARARHDGSGPGTCATDAGDEAPADVGDIELHDPSMCKIYRLADQAARSTSPVLVLGETGVGKEEVARYVHRRSPSHGGPLVVVNCAALPETLVESMLFGHEKGAFTGAGERRLGYVEAAAGGTLFLDELGELPPASQSKLLRFLDRNTITRLGSTAEVPVDVRIVAASRRDLAREAERGTFREDLYYRVAVLTIYVPPLRDRPLDILPLARRFARRAAGAGPRPDFTDAAIDRLLEHPWPGNVRELRNAVEGAVLQAQGAPLAPHHFPPAVQRPAPGPSATTGLPARVAEVERDAIVAALRDCAGNQSQAARKLGISRRTLIYRMHKYDIRLSRTTE
ncbi:MAG: sigma 54-interacting transcriptional regulator [Deltaproteobacteria bacterium]|nr:sigma 54-interacting transcriptional regulator [Deltaproteobacteria bacterium]